MSSDLITLVPLKANRSSELGGGESPKLNIASQAKVIFHANPLNVEVVARSFSYDETHTSRTKITTALKLRGSLDGNR